ncbi:MAG: type IV toxin-antitoxin system AbiEi family antitoxin domain-containing protein [Chloroflexi bacterium]|nr:type IV toxin-antitoxin system AbiEi family antitoxin domain-containing protein [Chloroflexota bacterium]MBV9599358.1 type IV toxin-antitoxin system AbiEi family antitoxin domain-containing protein [Chloroflexota bacterium]
MAPLLRIRDLAEGQWGLFTLRQARAAGVQWRSLARLADDGRIERVAHGVYRMRGGPEPDHLGLRAAWLQLDPAKAAWERLDEPDVAVVSHASAASLFEVGDLRPDIHEFTLPKRQQTRRSDVRLHRGRIPDNEVTILHGLPTTRAGRLIGDLVADNVEPGAVAQIAAEQLDRTYDSPTDVANILAPHAQRFGFRKGDGVGLMNYLLGLVEYRNRDLVVGEARSA